MVAGCLISAAPAQDEAADRFGVWRAALDANPGNSAAWRLAGDFLEQAGDSRAVDVRRQLVVNEPWELAHRVRLIHTALRFQQQAQAERALAAVEALADAPSDYAEVAATLAFASGYAEVADELLRAELLDNVDRTTMHRARAKLRLRFGRPKQIVAIRREFLMLARQPGAPQALWRELIDDALRRSDATAAVELGGEGAARAEAAFDDHLLRVNALLLFRPQERAAAIAALAARAAGAPDDASRFANWLIARGQIDEANAWLRTRPPIIAESPSVLAARSNGFVAAQQWELAWPLIRSGAWGPIAPEAADVLAATGSAGQSVVERAAWDELVDRSRHDLAALRVLYRFTLGGGRESERLALLQVVARHHPRERWAFQALADEYARRKDTAKLLALYSEWHDADSENIPVEGRLILLTLLTRPRPSPELRARIERGVMRHATDPTLATARALALWQLGREQEALQVTENVRSLHRRSAERALYHGLFTVAAGGRGDEAELYLARSEKAELLPEEEQLIRTARSLIARRQARR